MTKTQICHMIATWQHEETEADRLIDWFDERRYPTRHDREES